MLNFTVAQEGFFVTRELELKVKSVNDMFLCKKGKIMTLKCSTLTMNPHHFLWVSELHRQQNVGRLVFRSFGLFVNLSILLGTKQDLEAVWRGSS